MKITKEILDRLFELAKIDGTGEDTDSLKNDLESIIGCFEILKESEFGDLETTDESLLGENVIDDDIVSPPMENTRITANAPEKKDGYFSVPKTVE